jgi:signal transduction histidine kinase
VSPEQKNILFIFPEGTGAPAIELMYRTICNVIQRDFKEPLSINAEYLDRLRHPDAAFQQKALELIREKYRGKHIDLWVGGGCSPDLVRQLKEDFLGSSPAIILEIANPFAEGWTRNRLPRTTVVQAELNFRKNVELAMTLHPDTERVFVVAGTSPRDLFVEKVARHELQDLEASDRVVYLSGLPMDRLFSQLESLPARSVVLYASYSADPDGKTIYSSDMARLVAKRCPAPVYGVFSTFLGGGVVGGYVIDVERASARAGEYALRLLRGERAESIPLLTDIESTALFDWRQLQHFGIHKSRLPGGSVILHKELTLIEEYKWRIFAVGLFVALQTCVLLFLVNLNRKQKRTQRELAEAERRYRDLLHLDRVSQLECLSVSLAHELKQPLAAIRISAQSGLRVLETDARHLELLQQILENIVRDDKRAAEVLNSVLSLSSRTERTREWLAINALVADVLSILQSEASLRQVEIRRDLDQSMPPVRGDPVQLRQVIVNLIMNALDSLLQRPAHQREVMLQTRQVSHWAEISVMDSGPGIEMDLLDKVFEPFYTRKKTGTGMGLAVCSTIVQEHGGRIWAENRSGGGAVFTFRLPVE